MTDRVALGPVADPNTYWARVSERTKLVEGLLDYLADRPKKEKEHG